MDKAIKVVEQMIDDVEKRVYNVKGNDRYRGKANKIKSLENLMSAYIDVYWRLVAVKEEEEKNG